MGASIGNRKGFVSEINVTPFVDVMLVLLIIFMVTAPMMTEGLEISLPEAKYVEILPTDTEHVVLTVRKDDVIFINEYKTTREDLIPQLIAVVKDQNKQLYLQADKDVPYGVVVDVMGRVKAAGISDMSIVAERIHDEGAPAPGTRETPPDVHPEQIRQPQSGTRTPAGGAAPSARRSPAQ